MKKLTTLLIVLCFYRTVCLAQLFSFHSDYQPRMGLMDFGFSYGYMNQKNHEEHLYNSSTDYQIKTHFLNLHMDESMLSNWWYADENTRILFGFREVLDVGLGYGTHSTIYNNSPNSTPVPISNKWGLIFSYEAGFGGVYRINNKMDVGLNYYFLSLSSFNKNSDKKRYPKFRFRYSQWMGELSLKARTQFELKFLSNPEDDVLSSYIGITISGWNKKAGWDNEVDFNTSIVQLTAGLQL